MKQPTILALDSATEYCSVALSCASGVFQRGQEAPREHADILLPFIQSVLDEAGIDLSDVDVIAVGSGPGSFTGVRIAAGIAQGLAFSQSIPLITVSSLVTMAQRAERLHGASQVFAAIDARMGEVYWGTLKRIDGLMRIQGKAVVCAPGAVASHLSDTQSGTRWATVGTGFGTYQEALSAELSAFTLHDLPDIRFPQAIDMLPHAQAAWSRGETQRADEIDLEYVRNEVTWQKLPGR